MRISEVCSRASPENVEIWEVRDVIFWGFRVRFRQPKHEPKKREVRPNQLKPPTHSQFPRSALAIETTNLKGNLWHLGCHKKLLLYWLICSVISTTRCWLLSDFLGANMTFFPTRATRWTSRNAPKLRPPSIHAPRGWPDHGPPQQRDAPRVHGWPPWWAAPSPPWNAASVWSGRTGGPPFCPSWHATSRSPPTARHGRSPATVPPWWHAAWWDASAVRHDGSASRFSQSLSLSALTFHHYSTYRGKELSFLATTSWRSTNVKTSCEECPWVYHFVWWPLTLNGEHTSAEKRTYTVRTKEKFLLVLVAG